MEALGVCGIHAQRNVRCGDGPFVCTFHRNCPCTTLNRRLQVVLHPLIIHLTYGLALSAAAKPHLNNSPTNFQLFSHRCNCRLQVVLHPLIIHLTYGLALALQDYFQLRDDAEEEGGAEKSKEELKAAKAEEKAAKAAAKEVRRDCSLSCRGIEKRKTVFRDSSDL